LVIIYLLESVGLITFRPKMGSRFDHYSFADGVLLFLFTRGCARSSLTPGYWYFTLSG